MALGLGLNRLGRNVLGGVDAGPAMPAVDFLTSLYAVHGTVRVIPAYTGPLFQILRPSDGATMDVYPRSGGVPSKSKILAWTGGSRPFVLQLYDQTGNARHVSQGTSTKYPFLNLDSSVPTIEFSGALQEIPATTSLGSFMRNVGAATIVAVRKRDVTTAVDQFVAFNGTGTAATRATLGSSGTTGKFSPSGRRLDADALVRSTGLTFDKSWAVEVARFDWTNAKLYHTMDAQSETTDPFQTSGVTSNTSSTTAGIGSNGGAASYWNGQISLLIWQQAKASDTDVSTLVSSLASVKGAAAAANQFLSWGNTAFTGTYTIVASPTTYSNSPSGGTITEADLTSHRYRHHAACAYDSTATRYWELNSSGGTNEDAPGQMVVARSTTDGGTTWTALTLVLGAQSTFNATGAGGTEGSRVCYPRGNPILYNGSLYAVVAVDEWIGGLRTGAALIGAQLNADGSVGTPFKISTETYTAKSGIATIAYDAVLGPALFPTASLYGRWGGSEYGAAQVSWNGFAYQGGMKFTEPSTFAIDAGVGTRLQRLWRCLTTYGGSDKWLWSSLSNDGGATWSEIVVTDIPNSPSATASLLLPDGRLALVGNPQDNGTIRDPLYLALFNGSTGTISSISAVRQGLSQTPTYAGTAKIGGAAYPGACHDGTNLWIAHSTQKETRNSTKIPLSGL